MSTKNPAANTKLDTLGQVRLPSQIVLGSRTLTLEELSALREGTIIEYPQLAGEPVDLVVSGTTIAKGEVVVIDENFGIRITKVLETEGELPCVNSQ